MRHGKTVLLVDGYNIINAWSELKEMLDDDFEGAREKLNDYMFEYAAYYDEEVYVVYDAYLTASKKEKIEDRHHVHIVFTKENQTADAFIERTVKRLSSDVRIMIKVVTSDWVQQRQVLGNGGIRLTPWELKDKCVRIRRKITKQYQDQNNVQLGSRIDQNSFEKLNKFLKEEKK